MSVPSSRHSGFLSGLRTRADSIGKQQWLHVRRGPEGRHLLYGEDAIDGTVVMSMRFVNLAAWWESPFKPLSKRGEYFPAVAHILYDHQPHEPAAPCLYVEYPTPWNFQAGCGECGGANCGDRGDGLTGDDCCISDINRAGKLCSATGAAPCIIDGACLSYGGVEDTGIS